MNVKSFINFLLELFIFFSLLNIRQNNIFNNNLLSEDKCDIYSYVSKYNNSDVIGILEISSLNISIPVVQSNDNDYYLSHDLYKNKNIEGSVFLDYRNNLFLDRKILLFGHNSESLNTTFKKLENFIYSDFYSSLKHKKAIVRNCFIENSYVVSSVIVTENMPFQMKLHFNDEEWKSYIEWINEKSLYNDNPLSFDDNILVLQTCYYNPKNSYLLIVLKREKSYSL